MKVLYVGCNLFGQITNTKHVAIESFIHIPIDNLTDLTIGHSVLIIHKANEVFLNGHGLEPRVTHAITKLNLPENEQIIHISCSDTRIFFLNNAGELFVLDFLDRPVEIRKKSNFILKDYDFDDSIIKFVCGIGINVALSAKGRLFQVPNKLQFENENIVYICAGNEHCVLLDKEGNVFSFGCGRRGQLGHGSLEDEAEPRQIDALAGIKITKISSGSWHTCALSNEGDLYTWGWNSDGQLSLFNEEISIDTNDEIKENNYCKSENNLNTNKESKMVGCGNEGKDLTKKEPVSVVTIPTLVKFDEELNFINVACGSRHTILLTDTNVLFGSGCNKFNQLGLKKREAIYQATELHKLDKEEDVIDIKCGPGATAILLN